MLYMPFVLPIALLANLLSVALLGGGIYFLWAWYAGVVVGTAYLVGSIVAIAWSVIGRFVVLAFWPGRKDDPSSTHGGRIVEIHGASRSPIHVEVYGSPDATPLILTHGWGMDSTEWHYLKRQLIDRFQLIVWDLPGLGKSAEPADGRYSLERFAGDLKSIIALTGGRPAILVGHSIGGMTILTFCRLFPELVKSSVAGIVLTNTSDRTPSKTSTAAPLVDALLRPVFVPLLHLIRLLSYPVWAMQWLGYLNGSAQIVTALTGFAGKQTRGQIDRAAYLSARARPSVVARGVIAMADYDEPETLKSVPVPVLVVTANLDRLTIPEESRAMAEKAPSSELVRLSPGGHQAIWEQHTQLSQTILWFANRCLNAGSSRAA